jgi:hypothetical protein
MGIDPTLDETERTVDRFESADDPEHRIETRFADVLDGFVSHWERQGAAVEIAVGGCEMEKRTDLDLYAHFYTIDDATGSVSVSVKTWPNDRHDPVAAGSLIKIAERHGVPTSFDEELGRVALGDAEAYDDE